MKLILQDSVDKIFAFATILVQFLNFVRFFICFGRKMLLYAISGFEALKSLLKEIEDLQENFRKGTTPSVIISKTTEIL